MGNFTDVRVDEVILHILDPPAPTGSPTEPPRRGLILSERSLPSTTDARVFEYFREHLFHSLSDDRVRAARFSDLSAPIGAACKTLLAPRGNLVKGSQILAERLYAIMVKNSSIARGDLAVCRYSALEDGVPVRQLALLKLDPTIAFSQTTQTDAAGKSYVTVEIEPEVLPVGELQKCAFVRSLEPRPVDFDMLLLDRQLAREDVARFFWSDFLGSELVIDSRQATKLFCMVLTDSENELRATLPPEELPTKIAAFQQASRIALSQPAVNLNKWVKSLDPAVRKVVNTGVAAAHLPATLQLNLGYLAKVTQKVKYRGDFDLAVEIQASRFDSIITVTRIKPAVGPTYHQVVIKTQKWDKAK